MKRMLRRSKGFTLVEVLISTAILSVIGLSLALTLTNGFTLWERLESSDSDDDIVFFFEKLSVDLRNTIRFAGIDFSGTKEYISIPSFVSNDEGGLMPGRIVYRYDNMRNSFTRETEDYSQIYLDRVGVKKLMAGGIREAKFSYYVYNQDKQDYEWTELRGESATPAAVRLELVSNRPGFNYIKTIDIPIFRTERNEI